MPVHVISELASQVILSRIILQLLHNWLVTAHMAIKVAKYIFHHHHSHGLHKPAQGENGDIGLTEVEWKMGSINISKTVGHKDSSVSNGSRP